MEPNQSRMSVNELWSLAKEGNLDTNTFIASLEITGKLLKEGSEIRGAKQSLGIYNRIKEQSLKEAENIAKEETKANLTDLYKALLKIKQDNENKLLACEPNSPAFDDLLTNRKLIQKMFEDAQREEKKVIEERTYAISKELIAERTQKKLAELALKGCLNTNCNNRGDLKCSKCKTAMYCSKECQRQDWPKHKKTCKLQTA